MLRAGEWEKRERAIELLLVGGTERALSLMEDVDDALSQHSTQTEARSVEME